MPALIADTYYPISALMPHASTMLLLQDVIACGETFCEASVWVHPASLFFQKNKGVPVYVGIEYMAQTIALWSGIQMRRQGKPPSLGFLLGTRKYQANSYFFAEHAQLTVRVEQVYTLDGMGVFSCAIHEGDVLHASAQVNVFEPNDSAATVGSAAMTP